MKHGVAELRGFILTGINISRHVTPCGIAACFGYDDALVNGAVECRGQEFDDRGRHEVQVRGGDDDKAPDAPS